MSVQHPVHVNYISYVFFDEIPKILFKMFSIFTESRAELDI